MTEERIQFAPERQRGEQAARFGRGPSQMVGVSGALYKQLTRPHMTPNELAAWKLNQALEKYPEFTKEARENVQNEFVYMPGLRTMNMKLMAATISFLRAIKNNPTPQTFKDEIIVPHMNQLLPVNIVDQDEKRRLIIRFKAQILMYIRAIQIFRNQD